MLSCELGPSLLISFSDDLFVTALFVSRFVLYQLLQFEKLVRILPSERAYTARFSDRPCLFGDLHQFLNHFLFYTLHETYRLILQSWPSRCVAVWYIQYLSRDLLVLGYKDANSKKFLMVALTLQRLVRMQRSTVQNPVGGYNAINEKQAS